MQRLGIRLNHMHYGIGYSLGLRPKIRNFNSFFCGKSDVLSLGCFLRALIYGRHNPVISPLLFV